MSDIKALGATMAPLSVTYIAKNCCYITIQTTASSVLDVANLAAHQVSVIGDGNAQGGGRHHIGREG